MSTGAGAGIEWHEPVQTGARKRVGVLRVDGQAHDVVRMALKHPNTLPTLLPVPQLDGHVIAGAEDEGLCGMDYNRTDVVGVLPGGVSVGFGGWQDGRTASNEVTFSEVL